MLKNTKKKDKRNERKIIFKCSIKWILINYLERVKQKKKYKK